MKQANLHPLPASDLEAVSAALERVWIEHRGASIFMTGGTGFFGKWLQATFAHANREFDLGNRLTILTRNPARAREEFPVEGVRYVKGDVRDFDPGSRGFSHVIHAATPVDLMGKPEHARETLETCFAGTRSTLSLATSSKARFLLVSSGAVYGPQPEHLSHLSERYHGGPESASASSAYAEGKRVSETLVHISEAEHVIARCFAFVGPHLPLNGGFAAGQFLRRAVDGLEIEIKGSGRDRRSYLHMADLSIWLWTLLFRGSNRRVYNVGSDEAVTIAELGEKIARLAGKPVPRPVNPTAPVGHYVPDVTKAKTELGLQIRIPLDQALERTFDWLKSRG